MMINLAPTNEKLRLRVIRIVREILGCDEDEALRRLDASEWNIRAAVSMP
jgi:N-acetylmuramic acid 6-phosphate (MurNAc-6-P) etherase